MVKDDDIAAAASVLTVDPDGDPDGYAMLWQARVWQRWPGGHAPQLARLLAQRLRGAGTLIVNIDPAAARQLVLGAHLRAPRLRILLDRLVDAGLITPTLPGDPAGRTLFRLTLPAHLSSI